MLEKIDRGANDEARTVARGQLTITRHAGEGRCLVELQGELDLATADALRVELEAVEADGPEAIVVDLRGLRFIDSTGLSVLFDAVERAAGNRRRLTFTRSSPEVERTLRLTGLDRILSFDQPASLAPKLAGDHPVE